MHLRFALTLTLTLVVTLPAHTHADWPAQRHDAARTATGDGTSRIERPAIAFRHYLGGSLGAQQMLAHDVDGDGTREVVLIVGGSMVAKTDDDVVVWETGALDLFRIDALADLDGDGASELVVSATGGRVHVIDARSGAVRWSLPTGVVGNVGAVRLADLDRDGRPDVYLADNACGSTGSLGDVGRAYSFADGLATPAMLFELERGRRDYICGAQDTIVDIDGDGQLEVIAQGTQTFYVYSGVDGLLISASESVGSIPYGSALIEVANVDGDPAPELIAYTENSYAPPTNSRRVFVMDWDATAGRLVRVWERSVTDALRDRHAFGPGGVTDLGGDGALDVVTSFYDAAVDQWTTYVLDAATGAVRASVPRGPFRGLADLDGDGSPEVLTGDRTSGLAALRWSGGTLATMFLATRFEPLLVRRLDATAPSAAVSGVLAFDLDRTAPDELLGIAYSADGATATGLVALSGRADPPVEVARLPLEASVAVLMAASVAPVTRPYPQIVIARSDGYLWFLDEMLRATNADVMAEIPVRGLRIGGYYSGPNGVVQVPLAADLDGTAGAEIVVRDSRGVLQRLGAAGATLVVPPSVDWEIPGAHTPLLVDLDGDGRPEVVHWTTGTTAQLRAVRAADAGPLWQRTLGSTDAGPTNDLMAGDVDGNGQIDVVYSLFASSGGTVRINAANGASGARLWTTDFETVVAGSGLGVGSLWDRDGDGAIDVLAAPRNLLQWVRGQDGTAGATVAAGYPSYAIVRDVGDGDADAELTVAGTVFDARSFELDLTERWASTGTLHTRVDGAIADCPTGGPVFVQGHNSSPRLTAWRMSSGEIVGDVALRAGRAWEPPSAAPEGPGRLGNVTVSPNLTGTGRPGVLVPSTDGHLYAVDPCGMRVEWALDLRYPVGEAILADTDGDGEDEIVVTAADGFLYGIDREVIPAPAFVYENDGTTLATSAAEDLDELVTTDRLHANWAPVEGATSYEYAVITPAGSFVTRPNFVSAGAETRVTASGLPLIAGRRYLFAVRAIGPDGSSSEALSDGVVVLADPCDACGVGQLCVDMACVPDPCAEIACGSGRRCVDGLCVDTGSDASTPAIDGGADTPPRTGGGCCSVVTSAHGGAGAALAMAALVALGAMRRRRCDGGGVRARSDHAR